MPNVMPRPLSNQDAFNNVWQYFIVDRHPRALVVESEVEETDNFSRCRYRTADGRMCAVGCQLPDALYRPDMEGEAASTVVNIADDVTEYFCHVQPRLLDRLQVAHDYVYQRPGEEDTYAAMARKLREVAVDFGLNPPGDA
jgi:hypothetical protein